MEVRHLPNILADTPLAPALDERLAGKVKVVPWNAALAGQGTPIEAILTYGHLTVDGPLLDRFPHARVISNYGVGVDHIDVRAATARGIPVGNTPGILDGATADMGMTLLLAAARRLVEGDRFARGPAFTHYDPCAMLGREVHGQTLGIFGLGRIGYQIAKRARAFDMAILYHNRQRRDDLERSLPATFVTKYELLTHSDFVLLILPLTSETRGLIGAAELAIMKSTAILVNVARGPVVDTAALTVALQRKQIYGAALDVTDPEPLPRDHPLLALDNVTIAPHLGSATEQTRQRMAEMTVDNLLAGLRGEPLVHQINK
jgi:glyoxylate reductase